MTSTKDVIEHHLNAFAQRDLQRVLADYAPGALFFTQQGPLRGVDAIRPLFQGLIAEFAKPGATFRVEQLLTEGEYGYLLWTGDTADNVYELGTDTFIVRNGKIVAQTFAAKTRTR